MKKLNLKINWKKIGLILNTGVGILVALAIIGIVIGLVTGLAFETPAYKVDYAAEYQLKYYENKSKLVTEVEDYIQSKAPESNITAYHIVTECEEHDIDIVFILAQAQKESLFGTKGLSLRTNSVWNLGAFDNMPYDKISKRHKYQHPDESLLPYLQLLENRYLVNKSLDDLLQNFVDTAGHRYASDTRYEQDLKSIINLINSSTTIDSLESCMRYWKIKSQH